MIEALLIINVFLGIVAVIQRQVTIFSLKKGVKNAENKIKVA